MCMSLDFTYPSLEELIRPKTSKAENGMWRGRLRRDMASDSSIPGGELASAICYLWELKKMS